MRLRHIFTPGRAISERDIPSPSFDETVLPKDAHEFQQCHEIITQVNEEASTVKKINWALWVQVNDVRSGMVF